MDAQVTAAYRRGWLDAMRVAVGVAVVLYLTVRAVEWITKHHDKFETVSWDERSNFTSNPNPCVLEHQLGRDLLGVPRKITTLPGRHRLCG